MCEQHVAGIEVSGLFELKSLSLTSIDKLAAGL